MNVRILLFFSFVASTLGISHVHQTVLDETPSQPTISDTNAKNVFNAIHAAMRQWGSSIQHNGMSFFPAYIPERTRLYHGSRSPEKVTGMEWLAFEVDHAEMFALGRDCPPWRCRSNGDKDANDPLLRPPLPVGYLHVYETNRPLDRLLYIDGMGAAKTKFGTLDTQDLLLLNKKLDPFAEKERASLLCDLGQRWGVEGFLRMEAGFELILCNFSSGTDLISSNKRPSSNTEEGFDDRFLFEYMRSMSMRYTDIGAARVTLDFSSMVSAYFYSLNMYPDQSSKVPRLTSAHPEQLSLIKTDLQGVLQRPRSWKAANWQGVVDMIISRYQDRVTFLISKPSRSEFLATMNHLLCQYIDYSNDATLANTTTSSLHRCSSHYLQSVLVSTPQDKIIYHAISRVSERICSTLFTVRDILLANEDEVDAPQEAVQLLQDLVDWLDWSSFKRCPPCGYDEVCFVAAWPFGEPRDHFRPSCLNNTQMRKRHGWGSYWAYNETESLLL